MGDVADDAYNAAFWEDDEAPECDCADKVPANLKPDEFWTCPKCDAEWSGASDDQ